MKRLLFTILFLLIAVSIAAAQGPSVAVRTVTTLPSTCRATTTYTEIVFKKAADATRGFYNCNSTQNGWNGPYASTAAITGTINTIPKFATATTLGDSLLTDDATTLNYTGTGGTKSPIFKSAAADPADTGAVRLGNNEQIAWEAATPGTDLTLGVSAADVLTTNANTAITRAATGTVSMTVENTSAGTTNLGRVDVKSDATGGRFLLDALSSTYTPTATYDVASGTVVGGLGAGGMAIVSANVGSLSFWAGGTPAKVMNITAAGLISVPLITTDATHTDSAICQDTTTHVLYAGSGAAGICLGTSSRRYKQDFRPMTFGLREINALKPFSFHYLKGYGDDGARRQVGFIAEDVYKTMPSMVGLDKDGNPQSVDYMGVMVVATNAIKELSAKIDAQQREINRLKRQLRKHK